MMTETPLERKTLSTHILRNMKIYHVLVYIDNRYTPLDAAAVQQHFSTSVVSEGRRAGGQEIVSFTLATFVLSN